MKGNNDRITFLNDKRIPINNAYGYAIVLQSYSDDGLLIMQRYFDENEEPVCSTAFGFTKKNEYDENENLIRQTYFDDTDNPIITSLGYASVAYIYSDTKDSESGRVVTEFYYDEDGNQICLELGQYGLRKEYDGDQRPVVMTYLDATGIPIITTKGYATVALTYYPDNSVATQRYFDEKGNPVSLTEGQYGIKNENGKIYYLDADGYIQFSLMRALLNHQFLVFLIAIVIVFYSLYVKRISCYFLLTAYCGFILFATFMFREVGASRVKLEPFWSYKEIFDNLNARSSVLNNIWLFIPLGAILYKIYPHKIMVVVPLLLSIAIEVFQYFSGKGLCEVDDVINNSLGGIIGYLMGKTSGNMVKERKNVNIQ